MEMEGLDDVYQLNGFRPTKEEVVTYFLPRLLAGTPLLHSADLLIHHTDVYAREPKDLAAVFAPAPRAESTGDRFFFTTCRRKSGRGTRIARVAGAGTWIVNKTEAVYDGEAKVGEVKHLSFEKGKCTGWVMEEYRCLLPEAVVAEGEKVLCKIHLAQHPPATARQESNEYKLRQEPAEAAPAPQPETVTASTHGQKRPAAPVAAADRPCSKKMRTEVPFPATEEEEYEDCPVWFTPAAPAAFTEVPAAAEADGDTGRLSCSWEELFGEVQQQEQTLPVGAENNMSQLVFDEDIDQLAARIDWESDDLLEDLLRPWADDDQEKEEEQTVGGMAQEEQTLPAEAENNIDQPVASTNWDFSEELQSLLADHDEEEAQLYKRCNYNAAAADLHAPSLGGSNQFFSFAAVN